LGQASASVLAPFIIAVASRTQMLAIPVATVTWLVEERIRADAANGSRPTASPIQIVPKPIASISATARRSSAAGRLAIDPSQTPARPRFKRGPVAVSGP